MNDVRALLREAVATPPGGETDLSAVLVGGRRRVRRRRGRVVLGAVVALGVSVAALTLVATGGPDPDRVAEHRVPRPDGPVLRLSEAEKPTMGNEYQLVGTHRNKDLDSDNGQYYEGVTEDGLILFRDAPDQYDDRNRLALLDPATGKKQWLPEQELGVSPRPVLLAADRLVFVVLDESGSTEVRGAGFRVAVFDRRTRAWSTTSWAGLPRDIDSVSARMAPDGRLYVGATPRLGVHPPDGDVEDAEAGGDTSELWSVSLDNPADARDEGVRVGRFDFTADALVWSDRGNAANDKIHVRDLASGGEYDFNPRSGERCNLLDLAAAGERIVLSQHCGTYGDVRDDRVQILTTEGEPVTTIQGDSFEGIIGDDDVAGEGHLVQLRVDGADRVGTYVYDLATGRFLRVSESVSSFPRSGLVPAGYVLMDTAYGGSGATQWLLRWRS